MSMQETKEYLLEVIFVDGSVKTKTLTGKKATTLETVEKLINFEFSSDKPVQTWILQPKREADVV